MAGAGWIVAPPCDIYGLVTVQTSMIGDTGRRGGYCDRRGIAWHNLMVAMLLTAAQIALLIYAWGGGQAPATSYRSTVFATELQDDPEPPRPEEDADRRFTQPSGGNTGATGSPAIAQAQAPMTPIQLSPTEIAVAPVELLSPVPLPSLGEATVSSGASNAGPAAGDGAGSGSGRGNGDGDGVGYNGETLQLTTNWAPGFTMAKLRRFYPKEARRQRIVGRAELDCRVIAEDRVTDCRLLGEWPRGYGFGAAALMAEETYRLQVHDQHFRRVLNARVKVNAFFR